MPERIRGSRSMSVGPAQQYRKTSANEVPNHLLHTTTDPNLLFTARDADSETLRPSQPSELPSQGALETESRPQNNRRRSSTFQFRPTRSKDEYPEQDVYYDSRAATAREYHRRPTTLQLYYKTHPELLPQLPFTFRHGWPRYRLFLIIFIMVADACFLPIVLYYTMTFAGGVQGWIVFTVITSIWGAPTYIDVAIRTWRLHEKSNFYRPLGVNRRWWPPPYDISHYIINLSVFSMTTLLIIGSAPHYVWIRVLSMPGPALLYAMFAPILLLTLYNIFGWKAPFRINATQKGEKVRPGVFYMVEDVMAVNVGAGRPWREAMYARYDASARFRRMMLHLSLFWSIPALGIAGGLTAVAVCFNILPAVAYGVCWAVPFIWAAIWAGLTTIWVRRELRLEAEQWETDESHLKPTSADDLEKPALPESPPEPGAFSTTLSHDSIHDPAAVAA